MKKENIFLIVGIVLLLAFVIFLPKLNDAVFGTKVETQENENGQEEKQPTQYTCTSTTESNLANETKKTIFNLDKNGNVTTIDTTTMTDYNSKEEYNTNKKAAKALKDDGITYNISMDDKNYVLTVQSIQDISINPTTSYPTEYAELNKYLEQNNYICSTN